MKRIGLGLILLLALSFTAASAYADPVFTFTQAQLLAMVESYDNPPGIGDLDPGYPSALGIGALFVGDIDDGNPQWRSIGIGFPWGDPNLPGNLSAFGSYALSFKNVNQQDWWVNLYMNTGWTDHPWSETDNFYQNGWVKLTPGQSVTLVLDFTTEGVINLNHVTNIGFQIAFNDPTMVPGTNLYQGDKYHLQVNPVPEPSILMLLGVGVLSLGALVRSKRA